MRFRTLFAIALFPAIASAGEIEAQDINACKSFTAIFYENGKFNAGDADYLHYMNLIDQREFIQAAAARPGNTTRIVLKANRDCDAHIHYQLAKGGAQ